MTLGEVVAEEQLVVALLPRLSGVIEGGRDAAGDVGEQIPRIQHLRADLFGGEKLQQLLDFVENLHGPIAVSDATPVEGLGVYLWHEQGHAGGVEITWADADHHPPLAELRIEEV